MNRASTLRRTGLPLFATILVAICLTAVVVARQLATLPERADIVALAMTLDLVVGIPMAFHFLVVRPRALSIVTLVPILIASVLAASMLLPDDRQSALRAFELLLIPVELGAIGWIAWRARGAVRHARLDAEADPLQRLHGAAFELTRNARAAAILGSEIAVLYYGLGAWRAAPHVPHGATPHFQHRRSAQASVVGGFILVMAVEGVAVHLWLASWSPLAAWILTIGTIYGALWLLADYRATVLRPILVRSDALVVRAGLRFTLQIPRARIVAVSRSRPEFGKESVNLTLLSEPTHWLTLDDTIAGEGPYGIRRPARAIGIEPDAAAEFEHSLASVGPGA